MLIAPSSDLYLCYRRGHKRSPRTGRRHLLQRRDSADAEMLKGPGASAAPRPPFSNVAPAKRLRCSPLAVEASVPPVSHGGRWPQLNVETHHSQTALFPLQASTVTRVRAYRCRSKSVPPSACAAAEPQSASPTQPVPIPFAVPRRATAGAILDRPASSSARRLSSNSRAGSQGWLEVTPAETGSATDTDTDAGTRPCMQWVHCDSHALTWCCSQGPATGDSRIELCRLERATLTRSRIGGSFDLDSVRLVLKKRGNGDGGVLSGLLGDTVSDVMGGVMGDVMDTALSFGLREPAAPAAPPPLLRATRDFSKRSPSEQALQWVMDINCHIRECNGQMTPAATPTPTPGAWAQPGAEACAREQRAHTSTAAEKQDEPLLETVASIFRSMLSSY